ncbi:peptide chain release factor N(5)-glutamine methyltransferase [Candidatus Xianfuyuplasma coldseepsis]|uniref:Release factor glutamine methyltransferase n=1 Tax=Candidatus Xianfuyuplasma coldseepsis TaxID=2782163 RepID=A0A7L7KRE6_9MOLU|nr:peptide chain release factor N(5)-glutamine methyltransferase [Xianfuyuplasma coldseepsis]QMS85401.1 peptide chain release factor N(5)-glutamine methyltransferase [Xianfuyuplasma coldseepsis]
MPSYREILQINEQYAIDNQKESTGIKILLLYFSQMSSTELLLHMDDDMPEEQYQDFLYGVDRYVIRNIPVQHITGEEYFFGYTFEVNEDVLIPRFETEELVANVLLIYDDVFGGQDVRVLDIGTGSGCLAITLDLEEPHMSVTATDISDAALAVAKRNNEKLGANVSFYQGDLTLPVQDQIFDIIVSNPPYIPENEYVEDVVVDHEPSIALFGGEDGLYFYRRIIQQVSSITPDKFILAFEHAFNTAKALRKLIQDHFPDATIVQKKDMQGKDRMTFVIKE